MTTLIVKNKVEYVAQTSVSIEQLVEGIKNGFLGDLDYYYASDLQDMLSKSDFTCDIEQDNDNDGGTLDGVSCLTNIKINDYDFDNTKFRAYQDDLNNDKREIYRTTNDMQAYIELEYLKRVFALYDFYITSSNGYFLIINNF